MFRRLGPSPPQQFLTLARTHLGAARDQRFHGRASRAAARTLLRAVAGRPADRKRIAAAEEALAAHHGGGKTAWWPLPRSAWTPPWSARGRRSRWLPR